jgi:prepilin-type N-terminal cleavage/methylation domain-containing protein
MLKVQNQIAKEAQVPEMHVRRRERGFSLLELIIVLTITMIVASVAFISTKDAIRTQKADNALQNVLAVTRGVHQLAIDKRRVFMVSYDSTANQMTITVTPPASSSSGCTGATSQWPDAPATAQKPTPVLGNMAFQWVTGSPDAYNTAPDGIISGGSGNPVAFTSATNPTTLCFFPDGSIRDNNNQFNSGVVYLSFPTTAEPNTTVQLNNMRAMTVFGPTGRISGWRLTPASGSMQWKIW